jgi:hypothetical protein
MKLRLCLFLAAISLALATMPAETARRPRYGGVLRVEIGATVGSLIPAPAATNPDESGAKEQLDRLFYDRLFSLLSGSRGSTRRLLPTRVR